MSSTAMFAFLAVEFDPQADPRFVVGSLRQPALVVTALDLGRCEFIASVEVESAEALDAATARVARCPGVRSSTAFPESS